MNTLVPELVDPATLRSLAQIAVDAAAEKMASYADIRVASTRVLNMEWYDLNPIPFSSVSLEYAYGVRVAVHGIWGFAFGTDPTPEGVVRAARSAVATAQGLQTIAGVRQDWTSAPVAQGEWATPVQIDPFAVSPDDHAKLLGAYIDAAQRVPHGSIDGAARLRWTAETRVFASTEGSLITQHLIRATPRVDIRVGQPLEQSPVILPVTAISARSAGFESALGATLQEQIKTTVEDAKALTAFPEGNGDLGRYPVVFDGATVGALVGATLAPTFEMDRILGHDADGEGTSFFAPVDNSIGQPLFSSELNVTASRALPGYGAVKWDDEGVLAEAFPIVDRGCIVDCFTTRSTVSALSSWYAKRNKPLDSHGSAVAWTPTISPIGCASQLTVHEGAPGRTLSAMIRQMGDGLLVRGARGIFTDQQRGSGSLLPLMIFEVKQGNIARRLKNSALQFKTKQLWKEIVAFGDASTVQHHLYSDVRGETWAQSRLPILAPALACKSIDLIQIGDR